MIETNTITIQNAECFKKSLGQLMREKVNEYDVPDDKQFELFVRIRFAHAFSDYSRRIKLVQARLQSLSVLIYCNALEANSSLLYAGLY